MKISQELFQFPEPSLIIVTDSQKARLFFAYNGMLSEQESIRIDPHREGSRAKLFLTRSRGKIVRGGAPEKKDEREHVLTHLLNELGERTQRLSKKHHIVSYYLFAPEHLLLKVESGLHTDIQQKIHLKFPVDVMGAHPQEIVQRITEGRIP